MATTYIYLNVYCIILYYLFVFIELVRCGIASFIFGRCTFQQLTGVFAIIDCNLCSWLPNFTHCVAFALHRFAKLRCQLKIIEAGITFLTTSGIQYIGIPAFCHDPFRSTAPILICARCILSFEPPTKAPVSVRSITG